MYNNIFVSEKYYKKKIVEQDKGTEMWYFR